MKFLLLDRIVDLQPGTRITAHKALSRAEEYLADHFPKLPVMPGVLMLEAMFQLGAWLVRVTDDFEHSMVVLHEVRNVKYNGLVEPGQTLVVRAEIVKRRDNLTTLKTEGSIAGSEDDGRQAVSGRLVLRSYNLADEDPPQPELDRHLIHDLREQLALLYHPEMVNQT